MHETGFAIRRFRGDVIANTDQKRFWPGKVLEEHHSIFGQTHFAKSHPTGQF
jgi:hypothetical protein